MLEVRKVGWGTCYHSLYLSDATGLCWRPNGPGLSFLCVEQSRVAGSYGLVQDWCSSPHELGWLQDHGAISVLTSPWGASEFKWVMCF